MGQGFKSQQSGLSGSSFFQACWRLEKLRDGNSKDRKKKDNAVRETSS